MLLLIHILCLRLHRILLYIAAHVGYRIANILLLKVMLGRQHSVVVRVLGSEVHVPFALNTSDHLAHYLSSPSLCFLVCKMGRYKVTL